LPTTGEKEEGRGSDGKDEGDGRQLVVAVNVFVEQTFITVRGHGCGRRERIDHKKNEFLGPVMQKNGSFLESGQGGRRGCVKKKVAIIYRGFLFDLVGTCEKEGAEIP